jgi:hypothetical protein
VRCQSAAFNDVDLENVERLGRGFDQVRQLAIEPWLTHSGDADWRPVDSAKRQRAEDRRRINTRHLPHSIEGVGEQLILIGSRPGTIVE